MAPGAWREAGRDGRGGNWCAWVFRACLRGSAAEVSLGLCLEENGAREVRFRRPEFGAFFPLGLQRRPSRGPDVALACAASTGGRCTADAGARTEQRRREGNGDNGLKARSSPEPYGFFAALLCSAARAVVPYTGLYTPFLIRRLCSKSPLR